MTVPIAISPGRSGFGPELALSYDSGALNEGLGIEEVANEHGMAVEGMAKSFELSTDNARLVGATAAAISSIAVAPQIALERTVSNWFK